MAKRGGAHASHGVGGSVRRRVGGDVGKSATSQPPPSATISDTSAVKPRRLGGEQRLLVDERGRLGGDDGGEILRAGADIR